MRDSLESSKRKFHKLLENITASADRPSTPGASAVGASKRLRLTPRSRLAASHPLVNSQTNLRVIRRVPSEAVKKEEEDESKIPNFAPWNRDHFKRRLKTYASAAWWSTKPDAVNEVAWAGRGWICEGKNRVACKGGCEERVVVALRGRLKDESGKDIEGTEDLDADVDEGLIKKYEKLIVEGHDEDCLWRTLGCTDDIMRMPLARPVIWQPALRERYTSFVKAQQSLPSFDRIKYPLDLDAIDKLLGHDFFHPEYAEDAADAEAVAVASSPEVHKVALAFALLGWHGSQEGGPGAFPTATCPECFRRIGLWLYSNRPASSSSTYSPLSRSLRGGRPPSAGANLDDGTADEEALDLVDSHKSFCPWVNATSQATPGVLAGLSGHQIMEKVIANWAGFKARSEKFKTRYDLDTDNSGPIAVAEDASRKSGASTSR